LDRASTSFSWQPRAAPSQLMSALERCGCPNCHLKGSIGELAYVGIECPVCLQQTTSPSVILPCGHLFCRECFGAMGGVVVARQATAAAPKMDLQPGMLSYMALGAMLTLFITQVLPPCFGTAAAECHCCTLTGRAESSAGERQNLRNASWTGEADPRKAQPQDQAERSTQVDFTSMLISWSLALAAVWFFTNIWRLARQRFLAVRAVCDCLWVTFASLWRLMTKVVTSVARAFNALSEVVIAVCCSARSSSAFLVLGFWIQIALPSRFGFEHRLGENLACGW